MMIPEKLKSRKFWLTTLSAIAIVLIVAVFDVPEEQAEKIVAGIVGTVGPYLIGQGYADGQTGAAPDPEPAVVAADEV